MRLFVLPVLLGFALSGCSILSALEGEPKRDVFEILPDSDVALRCGRGRVAELVIEAPKTRGTLDSNRIMIRPAELQVAYLSDAQWGDTVPSTLQTLLIRDFGRYDLFSHVGPAPLGLSGDYALISTINDFNADAFGETTSVRLSVDAQIIRESDASVVASGRFRADRGVASTKAEDLVTAFNLAANDVAGQMTAWGISAFGVNAQSCRPANPG